MDSFLYLGSLQVSCGRRELAYWARIECDVTTGYLQNVKWNMRNMYFAEYRCGMIPHFTR